MIKENAASGLPFTFNPRVSIVIPVYNGANYLRSAISSALGQSYCNVEVVVVNDGSTDQGATHAIAGEYGDRIVYIRKENGGSSSALNRGIAAMTGDYFSWLSHDDLYHVDKVALQVQHLGQLLNSGEVPDTSRHIVVCGSETIGPDGESLKIPSRRSLARKARKLSTLARADLVVSLLSDLSFHGCSYLVPKSCFDEVGFFDESLRYVNDAEFWFRLLSNDCSISMVPRALVLGRTHREQITESVRTENQGQLERDELSRALTDWCKQFHNPGCARALFKYAVWHSLRGSSQAASFAYERSAEISNLARLAAPLSAWLFSVAGRRRRDMIEKLRAMTKSA